jgi:hypothetical protein
VLVQRRHHVAVVLHGDKTNNGRFLSEVGYCRGTDNQRFCSIEDGIPGQSP